MSDSVPTACVVFGATGDLMARKIVPSLFQLHEKGDLPKGFRLIGFARRDWSDDVFRDHVRAIVAGHAPQAAAGSVDAFLGLCAYVRGNFGEPDGYERLKETVEGNHALLYLSVPAESMPPILEQLTRLSFGRRTGVWTRLVVEKPIGRDGASGRALDDLFARAFAEDQIYRVDHYLAKDALRALFDFRFRDGSMEARWNAAHVARIRVHFWETLGVEKRGAFYDRLGTLRDVGQNHVLEMLAYATMEKPEAFDERHIRARRVDLLRALVPPAPTDTLRAQYDGYRAIVGVDASSMTETYFRVKTSLSSPRWQGVELVLESGKRMPEVKKSVLVEFKDGSSKSFDFDYFSGARTQYVAEYEKLFAAAFAGDQTPFLNAEEIDALWTWTDPIVAAWENDEVPLATYMAGTKPLGSD